MELYIESEQGHDTLNVPDKPEEVQKAVEGQLKDDKWVTIEKEDGNTEILTEDDIPDEEDEEEDEDEDKELIKEAKELGDWKSSFKDNKESPPKTKSTTAVREEWKSKFEDVKSATSVHKAKGG